MTAHTEIRPSRWRRTCFACWSVIHRGEKYARTITWNGTDATQLVEHVECHDEAQRLAKRSSGRPTADDLARRGWLADSPHTSPQWQAWLASRSTGQFLAKKA